jgi:hypothetical protein
LLIVGYIFLSFVKQKRGGRPVGVRPGEEKADKILMKQHSSELLEA